MTLTYFVDEIRTPFVINDIKRIAEKYDTIYLFSVNTLEGKEALPKNVVVFESFIDWEKFNPIKTVLANLFSILGIYINECLASKKVLHFKKSIALLASNIYKAESVMGKLNTECSMFNANSSSILHPSSSYYSFWFYDCIYLAWMRKKGWIEKAITRAHGGDLFEERGSLSGKILFRHFQFKHMDKVLSVSQTGTDYLQQKYSNYNQKIETVYLGSPSHLFMNPYDSNARFVIVSCAKVRNIKRIHKIAEMLHYIDYPITWYHIGDENINAKNDPAVQIYLTNKKKLKENKDIQFVAKGLLSNEEIMQFYKITQINLFISLSEAEGVPVSMMEAISFGIPILSTDVGGCKEIATNKTGILIPLQTGIKEIATIIKTFKNSEKNISLFRKGVRGFWEENFDAEQNYKAFMKIIAHD